MNTPMHASSGMMHDLMTNQTILTPKKRWATVKMMPTIYPGVVTESGLRWIIFNEFHNGFHECVRRMGSKVLIDLDDFEKWIDASKRQHYTGPRGPSWK
ncbi:MAG: hypothetical protein NTV32_09235 [Gammaproteobacteria bacterium]|jgi:hypothetical protein|nr:hypothetical protein [Gammaproteobacteria bacterium]